MAAIETSAASRPLPTGKMRIEESRARHKGEKFSEYERGGVREYWLIDPARRQAEFYVLRDGVFQPASFDNEGIYRSTVLPGFWMRVDWLWQLPPLSQVTKQWL